MPAVGRFHPAALGAGVNSNYNERNRAKCRLMRHCGQYTMQGGGYRKHHACPLVCCE